MDLHCLRGPEFLSTKRGRLLRDETIDARDALLKALP
jgi:hypothetical protein